MSLKCYSDWKFGAIQIELTTLTLRITEDSAKQLVIKQNVYWVQYDQTDWIWEYILCFACTFRDVNTADGIFTWAKVTLIKKQQGIAKLFTFLIYFPPSYPPSTLADFLPSIVKGLFNHKLLITLLYSPNCFTESSVISGVSGVKSFCFAPNCH